MISIALKCTSCQVLSQLDTVMGCYLQYWSSVCPVIVGNVIYIYACSLLLVHCEVQPNVTAVMSHSLPARFSSRFLLYCEPYTVPSYSKYAFTYHFYFPCLQLSFLRKRDDNTTSLTVLNTDNDGMGKWEYLVSLSLLFVSYTIKGKTSSIEPQSHLILDSTLK